MNESVKKANQYIEETLSTINNQYRLKYHMSPRVGWMNDPNGLIYFNGKYHLYYQANPYKTKPGKMLWGQFESSDLIKFEDKGIALALDGLGENAYSGGAIENNGEINIFYTLHTEKRPEVIRYDGDILEGDEILTEEENEKRKHEPKVIEGRDIKEEEVYHSSSKDGTYFAKGKLVFDNDTLPENISRADFRDPCPVKIGEYYYVFLGGKEITKNQGLIVVLKSKTFDNFQYAFTIGPLYELGDMGECPSYFRIGDKDVLLASGSNTIRRDNDFRNINCSIFIVGNIDFEAGKMDIDYIKEIDKGDTFYAPQFIRGLDEAVMIGWLEMWGKKYPTRRLKHGYVGAFSIPRRVFFEDGDICQLPVDELKNYFVDYEGELLPRQANILVKFNGDSTLKIVGDNGELVIGYNGKVYLDNTKANNLYECMRETNNKYENLEISILLDTSSIEIFVSGGHEVISSRFFLEGDLRLVTVGNVSQIKVQKIGDKE